MTKLRVYLDLGSAAPEPIGAVHANERDSVPGTIDDLETVVDGTRADETEECIVCGG